MTILQTRALAAAMALTLMSTSFAFGQSAASSDPTEGGKAVFKRANCVGCHKWHGNGGGGYGGDALSLRKTELTRDQIIETVACGRPSTGMPFFVRGAYESSKCFGMTRADVGPGMPPEGAGHSSALTTSRQSPTMCLRMLREKVNRTTMNA
jgi:cytochrome c553